MKSNNQFVFLVVGALLADLVMLILVYLQYRHVRKIRPDYRVQYSMMNIFFLTLALTPSMMIFSALHNAGKEESELALPALLILAPHQIGTALLVAYGGLRMKDILAGKSPTSMEIVTGALMGLVMPFVSLMGLFGIGALIAALVMGFPFTLAVPAVGLFFFLRKRGAR